MYKCISTHIRAAKYAKQGLTELKGKIDGSIRMVEHYSTSFSIMNKINRGGKSTNSRLEHYRSHKPNRHRALPPTAGDDIFFSNREGKFSRVDHILGHKTSLKKLKNIEIISGIFSDCNGMKL